MDSYFFALVLGDVIWTIFVGRILAMQVSLLLWLGDNVASLPLSV
jgi:hypothetical protein